MRTLPILLAAMLLAGELPAQKPATARAKAARRDTTPPSANALFDSLVARHVRDRARRHPEWATSVGLHAYDPLLDDRRATARAADSAAWAALGDTLAAMDTAALDERRRVNWLLLNAAVAGALQDAGTREWQRRPGSYVPFQAVYSLAIGDTPGPKKRFESLVNRLEGWPIALAQGRAQVVPARTPRLWVELDIRSAEGIARWMDGELVDRAEKAKAADARFDAAVDAARRALFAYTKWMRDTLRHQASGDWKYGAAAYDRRLHDAKLLDESAESLVLLGRSVYHETERELEALAERIAPGRTWRELLDSAKSLHPARDSVFAAYSAESRRARAFIQRKKLFMLPPGERLDMILTPPHLRGTYAYGGYSPAAPFEARQVGRFFVTPVEPTATPEQAASKLRGHNNGWITVVALHEGYPGHHLQYVRAARNPDVVRRLYGSEVFGEGWGLYVEELMYREGFYPDSLTRLVQLQARLWRAARVIIDPSIHTGKMSFDRAVAFFTDSVGLEKADATAEVNRYTTWPTQAPSYILGMRTMFWLRLEAERRAEQRGEKFDLARFHDRVLAAGSLPPVLLRRAVLGRDSVRESDSTRAGTASRETGCCSTNPPRRRGDAELLPVKELFTTEDTEGTEDGLERLSPCPPCPSSFDPASSRLRVSASPRFARAEPMSTIRRGGPSAPEPDYVLEQAPVTAKITVLPARPVPGALVRVRVRATAADTVTGTLAGERLHFVRERGQPAGTWLALGGIPLDSAPSAPLALTVAGADTSITVRLAPPPYRRETLTVAPEFGTEPDSALEARLERESRRAREVSVAAHDTPKLWTAPFVYPRPGRVTSPFGTSRTFNGQVRSRHLGTDFAGATGAPIKAINRGVVRIVDRFYLGGNVVYVDHGAGLVTAYLHQSRTDVAVGDTVRKGQVIGRVGSTGRVTGPHLHLIVRYGGLTLDPMSLLRPMAGAPAAAKPAAKPGAKPAPKRTTRRPTKASSRR